MVAPVDPPFAGPDGDIWARIGIQSRLIELINAAVIVVDLEGTIIRVNQRAEDLFGWSGVELVGRPSSDFAADVLHPDVRAEISNAVMTGTTYEGIFSVERKDGEIIRVRVTNSPLYTRDGSLVGVFSIVLDATYEQEIEHRLDEQTRVAGEYKFLAECTTAIASSLDYASGIQALARLSAGFLGDVCLIDGVETGTGNIRRLAAAHRDPTAQPLVDRLLAFLPDPTGEHPAVHAIRNGGSAISESMTDTFLQATTRDEEHLEIVRRLGFQSFICVPLIARGRILGALTLLSCSPERRFGASDLDLAEELAWRAALALDTARLFEERSRVARVLQASLLPPSLPHIDGARLAARYVAAEESTDVGGDFYDVFDAGYRAWAVTIGDVCGRGPQAATVTGLVRHTVRSLALTERDPGRVLGSLNAVLNRDLEDPGLFCTVCYGMLRSRADGLHLRLASGGHPPPIIIRHDGRLEDVRCAGLMLGPFENGSWQTCTATLRPGDTAVFYTDGVSEAQRDGVQFGDHAFQDALSALARADPQLIADTITEAANAFAGGASHDDMAVLVVQATGRVGDLPSPGEETPQGS
jgi:PAS domain S-box-containing protein